MQVTLVLWSVVFLWLYSWGPSLTQIVTQGRSSLQSDFAEGWGPLAGQITKATMALTLATLLFSILASISDRGQRMAVRLWVPLALVLPWCVIYLVETVSIAKVLPAYYEFIWPLMLVAFVMAPPPVRDVCVLLARICITTAGISIALGLSGQGLMPYGWHQTDDKALIGDAALAGPYSHSNILGLAMALAVPFVLLALRGKERLVGSLLVGLALVWSASRISIAAAVLVACATAAVGQARRKGGRGVVIGGWMASAAAIFIVPLSTEDDAAFTNRGLIWKVTRFYVSDHPVFGWGTKVFQSVENEFAKAIGARAVTAHNLWLTLFAVGGWVAVAATVIALVAVAIRFARKYISDTCPALFLFAFLVCEIAEDPLRAWRLSPHSFIVWTGLALAVCVFGVARRPEAPAVQHWQDTARKLPHVGAIGGGRGEDDAAERDGNPSGRDVSGADARTVDAKRDGGRCDGERQS